MSSEIRIRPGRPDERSLVLQSFVREYRGAPYATGVPPNALTAMMTRFLDAWGFSVAVEPESDEILGFAVGGQGRIAWLQVKRLYRRRGVAKALLSELDVTPGRFSVPFLPGRTELGPNFGAFAAAHGYRLQFRPWLALHV